jgi:uncharacterized protein (DUF1501 family)
MEEKKKNNLSRRKFIGQTSCAAVGYTTLLSSLLSLKAFEAAAVDNSAPLPGYKALVCVLLSGGADSYNMLMPRGGGALNDYLTTRSNLAIPASSMLQIDPTSAGGQLYGVHPSMPEIQALFQSGRLAFISNVGTMVEPTTVQQFYSGSHPLPLGIFSHSDQIQQWQTGRPHERSATGWGGRIADLISSMNTNQNISMNISMSGTNVFQRGASSIEYAISNEGSVGINGYNEDWIVDQLRSQAIDNMLDASYVDIYKSTYVNTIRQSKNAGIEFQAAIDVVPEFTQPFSPNYLSQSFRMIAKTIAAREALGFERQIFFVNYGGWDHHDELLNNQAAMLTELSLAFGDFNTVLDELGVANDVTTFSISDFARTLTSNGNGTDHAWGGNAMVMGGAVNGGDIYGTYPSLALGSPLDLTDGTLVPTTSADEYIAELALWFGVSPSNLNDILPNLNNFYDTNSPDLPLGFLNL